MCALSKVFDKFWAMLLHFLPVCVLYCAIFVKFVRFWADLGFLWTLRTIVRHFGLFWADLSSFLAVWGSLRLF